MVPAAAAARLHRVQAGTEAARLRIAGIKLYAVGRFSPYGSRFQPPARRGRAARTGSGPDARAPAAFFGSNILDVAGRTGSGPDARAPRSAIRRTGRFQASHAVRQVHGPCNRCAGHGHVVDPNTAFGMFFTPTRQRGAQGKQRPSARSAPADQPGVGRPQRASTPASTRSGPRPGRSMRVYEVRRAGVQEWRPACGRCVSAAAIRAYSRHARRGDPARGGCT